MRSYVMDPPGSGRPTGPDNPAGDCPLYHASFYAQARKALGLSWAVVFGHSSGALAALACTAMYPRSTAACVAVAPVAGPPADAATTRRRRTQNGAASGAAAPWFPEGGAKASI